MKMHPYQLQMSLRPASWIILTSTRSPRKQIMLMFLEKKLINEKATQKIKW
jgi:hypothetical protein